VRDQVRDCRRLRKCHGVREGSRWLADELSDFLTPSLVIIA
jgi:hypothetical protein